jgi:hypothetical protein
MLRKVMSDQIHRKIPPFGCRDYHSIGTVSAVPFEHSSLFQERYLVLQPLQSHITSPQSAFTASVLIPQLEKLSAWRMVPLLQVQSCSPAPMRVKPIQNSYSSSSPWRKEFCRQSKKCLVGRVSSRPSSLWHSLAAAA